MKQDEFDKEFDKAKAFLDKKGFVVSDRNLKAILAAKEKAYPVFLVGPTGSGKTMLLQLMAEFWGGVYDYQSLNGSITIHDLTQERILDKNGKFIERDMVLATWLRNAQKSASILHLDEINAARPETLLALHPIMDLKGCLVLPYTDEVLKANNNSILVMSANEGDEYQGINGLNMAFQNRLVKIHLPYIQGDKLVNRLVVGTGVSKESAQMVVNTWSKYMESRDSEQPVVGIRILERWCELSKFMGLKEAGIVTFASLIARDDDELATIIEGDMFVNLPNKR